MKKLFTLLTILIASLSLAKAPVKKLVPISDVFSPQGFDSNDNTEIIVEGLLPNLCYQSPFKKVEVQGNNISITVGAYSDEAESSNCAEMVVPFLEVVDVGVLDKGNYNITVNKRSIFEKKSKIRVEESVSDAIDDVAYANVEYIEKSVGTRTVLLKGHNPSDCFVKDGYEVLNNKKDVYSILPKMKRVSDFCPMKMVPFQYEVEVPKDLKANKVLLHVRVLNGKSVNSVFRN